MIKLKSPAELERMRRAGSLLASVFVRLADEMRPGIAAADIDRLVEDAIAEGGATPAFKGYRAGSNPPFPASACISIDEEVVHGIPGNRVFKSGQVVGVDAGLELDGWFADMAASFLIGEVSERNRLLWRITRQALYKGIEQARPGKTLNDVGGAVQDWVEQHGLYVVRDLVGHGIGSSLHEDPPVPNYRNRQGGVTLQTGMTLAVEPMVAQGTLKIKVLKDGWTAVTADRSPACHFEHTVAITEDGPQILTLLENGDDPWRVIYESKATAGVN